MLSGKSLRYELYRVAGNPYVNQELNPLDQEAHRSLLAELAGFIELEEIDRYLRSAIAARRSAFFLLTGKGGSGRTSLANHILFRYHQLRELPGRLVVNTDKEMTGYDDLETIRTVFLSLRNQLFRDALLDPDLQASFAGVTRRGEGFIADFELLAGSIGIRLANSDPVRGLGVRFEKIRNASLLPAVRTVFEARDAEAVVIFTHNAYEHSNTPTLSSLDLENFAKFGHRINLSPLRGHQVRSLVEHRWTLAADAETPCPFDYDGVQEFFDVERDPIAKVLLRLAEVLDYRLELNKSDVRWPENPNLRLDKDWLLATLNYVYGDALRRGVGEGP